MNVILTIQDKFWPSRINLDRPWFWNLNNGSGPRFAVIRTLLWSSPPSIGPPNFTYTEIVVCVTSETVMSLKTFSSETLKWTRVAWRGWCVTLFLWLLYNFAWRLFKKKTEKWSIEDCLKKKLKNEVFVTSVFSFKIFATLFFHFLVTSTFCYKLFV